MDVFLGGFYAFQNFKKFMHIHEIYVWVHVQRVRGGGETDKQKEKWIVRIYRFMKTFTNYKFKWYAKSKKKV